jgi:hypothetical protein
MADLEQRLTALEREMSALKSRVGAAEEDGASIPDLIKLEFRLANSQIARQSRDLAGLRSDVADLKALKGDVEQLRSGQVGLFVRVEAMPRILAELVTRMLDDRSKRR